VCAPCARPYEPLLLESEGAPGDTEASKEERPTLEDLPINDRSVAERIFFVLFCFCFFFPRSVGVTSRPPVARPGAPMLSDTVTGMSRC
jgi:hypothetical protein